MKFLLFDRTETFIGHLKDVLSARHSEEINGEDILELNTLDTVEKGQRILYKDNQGYWHEFIIRGVDEVHDGQTVTRTVFAESSFYETIGDYVEDKRPYNVPANIALENALLTTRWEVGIVDDLGLNSTNFYHISAKEAVQKVAETWQGELRYRIEVSGNKITGRYVDLLASRGQDLGKRFAYTKDLISITKTVHRDDVITALYGYGKGEEIVDEEGQPTGGYGRRITFGEINGGKNYVENNDARLVWGRLNPDGTRSHVFGKVEFDDCEDPEQLLQLTTAKLEELSQPIISYEASVIDLKAFGIEHEGVELGDTVGVIDREFRPELRLKARVVKVTRDLLEPENTMIVLGNFIPSVVDSWNEQEQYINNFRSKQGVWDRSNIINDDGTINAQFLKNLVDELNTRMNALGGYVYLSEDGKGLITYDKPIDQNPTMAIQLLGGAFRIANSKLPNGEWNWRTFGDGNGFVADAFIGGLLKGGKVHFDLTNGTLLIGDSVEDYALFWDGSKLNIKGALHITPETTWEPVEEYTLNRYAEMTLQEIIDTYGGGS
jgi:phage minor structural protein